MQCERFCCGSRFDMKHRTSQARRTMCHMRFTLMRASYRVRRLKKFDEAHTGAHKQNQGAANFCCRQNPCTRAGGEILGVVLGALDAFDAKLNIGACGNKEEEAVDGDGGDFDGL